MTAIDKLYNEIEKVEQYHVFSLDTETVKLLLDEIKAEHKKDIIKAIIDVLTPFDNYEVSCLEETAEEYYNETF